jgi:DNA-binding NtrC family response regulator
MLTPMLIGSTAPSHPSNSPRLAKSPQPGSAGFEDWAACPPFVCVSLTLRRLLLQAEITAPRLTLATFEGEAGTGKHLLAQNIHRNIARNIRRQSEPVHHLGNHPVNHLVDQRFHRHDAREWLANETDVSTLAGTLYLDRVDLLASPGQGLLLNLVKALQSEAIPHGRFLLLVSAHESLRQLAGQGAFLPDLAFRLTAVRFLLPPLREHREDIAPIAQVLIDRICRRYQQPTAVLAQGALPHLLRHTWPGNVRELASLLESAILDSTTGVLSPDDLGFHFPREAMPQLPNPASAAQSGPPEDLALDAAIRHHIQLVLDLNRGNKLRAARQLGISRSTLYRLLAGASISPEPEPTPQGTLSFPQSLSAPETFSVTRGESA